MKTPIPRRRTEPEADTTVIGLTPFERPDPRLALALLRAGAMAVLDLGRDAAVARAALDRVAREARRGFGVRIPSELALESVPLPSAVELCVLEEEDAAAGGARLAARVAALGARTVLVQATSVEAARGALDAGAAGIIAKGSECGGRVGEETTFVLLQRLVALGAPVWAQGGIGLHSAAACIAGGAAGVVLDGQLALVRESSVPAAVQAAVRSMDGSETALLHGHRVFSRPGTAAASTGASLDEASLRARLGASDLDHDLVPVGQDAAFARGLAERFGTAGGVVHALRTAIADHLAAARATEPLRADSPLAAEHGVRWPIAQGPMTRVSDRASFADAVSQAGALPFLALSLMRGDEIRALLEETRARLGERPFGVGILGFVPEEVRDEQLAVLRELRPAVAIIAGGRPSRARPLEEQGTLTYLHVPSPGLLELFLRDGARSFVFEGRECGGHVGPRTSFVLWEMQIDRLLAHAEPTELRVLFAGGIHDARSAAMVAAMAAPLAARGAKIGVLMGTAYLFTEEAVQSGAIEPGFQEAALRCQSTVLLETAPGHATRCVDSDYVRAFHREKVRLEGEGRGPEDVWAELEQLNLGRLRIAAKGLRREGDMLVRVDGATQAREGMFMIGQLAALRGEKLTMAELHRDVCEGAGALLRSLEEAPVDDTVAPAPIDVAIVGIACIFPDAPDRHAYWANIATGKASITEVPKERWDTAVYYDKSSTNGEKSPSKWGGFLPTVPFDPLTFGIPPKSLAAIEPVQLLCLQVARQALDDAGYGERAFDRERCSVVFGAEAGTELSSAYGFRALWPRYAGPIPPELDASLPRLTEDSFPGVLANVIAGRIANRLDLGGVNYTVDAACAASLAAVDLAVKELSQGSSDMVLCGGADVHNSIVDYLLFASVHALSPTGACRAFDSAADGIVLGEGVACVVLKRLADAERDGDRIYAVIKGVAGGSDGKSLGLTAPRKEGQVRALCRAYRDAGVSPREVGLVEAHGTGTVVGDRTELATLTEVYGAAGVPAGSVALGSVKSQIGHTKCAAGIAGLIKVALSLHHKVLPPTLHIQKENPGYDAASSPFVFGDVARPWPAEERKGAVSAFGFGGTNFHAILAAYEGADPPASGLGDWPAELFLFRARDRAGALTQIDRLEAYLGDGSGPSPRLCDLARSVSERRRRDDGPVQVAVVATSTADLRDKLVRARTFTRDPRGVFVPRADLGEGKTAFLFPGQGSQRPGMLAELFVAFPALQRFLQLGAPWVDRIYPPLATSEAGRAAQVAALTDTRAAQPALGMVSLALAELLGSLGVRADVVAGHSYGELAALCFAGALEERELFELSAARGRCILEAAGEDPGTMAAVTGAPDAVRAEIAGIDGVVIANENAPDQTVISGRREAVAAAIARLEQKGMRARTFPVACAFHSPVVAAASATFAEHLAAATVRAPRLPVYANTSAAPHPADPAAIRRALAEHVARPVRFAAEIEAMYAAGVRTFIEVGPGRVLGGLVAKVLRDRPHRVIACDGNGEGSLRPLLAALAELAVGGTALDVTALFAGRGAKKIDLASAAPLRHPPSTWLVDGHLARPLHGEPPPGAFRALTAPVVAVAAPAPATAPGAAFTAQVVAAPADGRQAAVLEFLRASREIVEAQRQVLLAHLGEPATQGVARTFDPQRRGQPFDEQPSSLRLSAPPLPSFSPPARSLPPGARSVPPPSLAGEGSATAPRAGRLPAESSAWMREMAPADAASPTLPPAALCVAPVSKMDVQATLLAIVSDRTGYPTEMLGLDLNLEAELSIDSIKRIEILGQLGHELGLLRKQSGGGDELLEQLATKKTLRTIVAWLEEHMAAQAGGGSVASGAESASAAETTRREDAATVTVPSAGGEEIPEPPPTLESVDKIDDLDEAPSSEVRSHRSSAPAVEAAPGRSTIRRFVIGTVEAPHLAGSSVSIARQTWALVAGRSSLAAPLQQALVARGAKVVMANGTLPERLDGIIDLSALGEDAGLAPEKALFDRALAAHRAGVRRLLVATVAGGPGGREHHRPRPGVAGLLRTLARETGIEARAIGLDLGEAGRDGARLVEHLVTELETRDDRVEVAWQGGVRRATTTVAVPRARAPGKDGLRLGSDSVVLVTGGARGITAAVTCALARRFQCRLELVGRSAAPTGVEDADLASAADMLALRKAIIARGERSPAAIEALATRVLAAREIGATMRGIVEAGASVGYHALDVRDERAVHALVDDLYARHGRIDGVIHGAGLIEDKLLADKTRASFDRVFDTKVVPARALLERLRADVGFVAFFSSIAAVFGSRGQIDYAAANDALDKLAWWQSQRSAARVLSVNWGPWAGGGMVSPELERQYARRGIGLVDPGEGAAAFLEELLEGTDPQVVLMNAEPEALSARPSLPGGGPDAATAALAAADHHRREQRADG